MYNIVVSGTRGKSTTVKLLHKYLYNRLGLNILSKISGKKSYLLYNDKKFNYYRDRKNPFIEREIFDNINMFNADINIIENQAIDPVIVRHINKILSPRYILLTNFRRDHIERYGNTREEVVERFALTIPREPIVLVSDDKYNNKFESLVSNKVIKVEPMKEIFTEALVLTDTMLQMLTGQGVSKEDIVKYLEKIENRYKFKETKYFKYLNGAGLNDIDSTKLVLDKLKPSDLTLIMNVRKDRWSRSVSFIELFNDDSIDIDKVCLVGNDAQTIKKHIKREVTIYPESNKGMLELLKLEGNVMSVGNSVTKFMYNFNKNIKEA